MPARPRSRASQGASPRRPGDLRRGCGRGRGGDGASRRALILTLVVAQTLAACAGIVELEPGDPVVFVQQPQTSRVLTADGSLLAELHAEQDRTDVTLNEMAPSLVQAVVAIEDRRFFLHAGVDVPAIARAAVANVDVGGIAQGGSTITQQYVKNTMTGPARTLQRKLEEAALAYQLEQRYSKQEILERYLNTVYFGKGAYGISAAAHRFFGVEPDQLSLAQSTLLAGMIQSPSRFDPYEDPEAALDRRRLVLDAMVQTGAVDAAEGAAIADSELDLEPPPAPEMVQAPWFLDAVKRALQHDPQGRFGVLGTTVDERVDSLFTGGLRITTTLDPRLQRLAEQAVAQILPEPDDPRAAVVVLDPRTGAVRALVGGRDYHDPQDPSARFDLATQALRQPGSSFKPIVLAAALERGIGLDRTFPGGACATFERVPGWDTAPGVCNYGGTAYGETTLREATVRSINTVYARLAVEMGPAAVQAMAYQLGIASDLPQVHALALGAGEVTPLDMAAAYQPFATLGEGHPPFLIERIETAAGEVLFEHQPAAYRVLNEAAAYFVTETLQEVVRRGTGVRADIGRPQAGKTGTSQDNADAWFIGYTPELLAAVWVGFPQGRIGMQPPVTREVVEGGRWPAEIWRALMEPALADTPVTAFPAPAVDLVAIEVDGTRGCLPNPYTPPEVIEVREYLAGTQPTTLCTEPTGPPIDDVPNVTGLPLSTAERLLEERGFVIERRPIDALLYPPGFVERQRPEPGGTTLAEDGNAVVLWVTVRTGRRVQVPDVVGLDAADAIATLEAAGWVVHHRQGCPDGGCDAPGDTVVAQDPPAGQRAREHAVITILTPPD